MAIAVCTFIKTNWYQQFGAASHGYSGVGSASGGGGGSQTASRRCERMIHVEEIPQSLIHPCSWASIPKNHRSLEKWFDTFSRPTHDLLQSRILPWASPKAHRGPQRPLPGPWVPVGCGRWPLHCRLAPCAPCTGRLHPWHMTWLFVVFIVMTRLLPVQWDALDTQKNPIIMLPKVLRGFWRLATWQQAHTTLLADPENALSGCLELRRTRIKL